MRFCVILWADESSESKQMKMKSVKTGWKIKWIATEKWCQYWMQATVQLGEKYWQMLSCQKYFYFLFLTRLLGNVRLPMDDFNDFLLFIYLVFFFPKNPKQSTSRYWFSFPFSLLSTEKSKLKSAPRKRIWSKLNESSAFLCDTPKSNYLFKHFSRWFTFHCAILNQRLYYIHRLLWLMLFYIPLDLFKLSKSIKIEREKERKLRIILNVNSSSYHSLSISTLFLLPWASV